MPIAYGCLALWPFIAFHSKKPSTGTMQRRFQYASPNVGRSRTVSHLALMGLRPPARSWHFERGAFNQAWHLHASSDPGKVTGQRWPQPSMPSPFRQIHLDVKGEQSIEQLGLTIKMMLAEPAARNLFVALLE
jgi:hypothetical protein